MKNSYKTIIIVVVTELLLILGFSASCINEITLIGGTLLAGLAGAAWRWSKK